MVSKDTFELLSYFPEFTFEFELFGRLWWYRSVKHSLPIALHQTEIHCQANRQAHRPDIKLQQHTMHVRTWTNISMVLHYKMDKRLWTKLLYNYWINKCIPFCCVWSSSNNTPLSILAWNNKSIYVMVWLLYMLNSRA